MPIPRTLALVRALPLSFSHGALRTHASSIVDQVRAFQQHEDYCAALKRAGCELLFAKPRDELPDSVFVEDTTVVHGRTVMAFEMGHGSRRKEQCDVLLEFEALGFQVRRAKERMDGGDVLFTGKQFFVGVTSRTTMAAVKQFAKFVDVEVTPVENVRGGLHLKSVCSRFGHGESIVASERDRHEPFVKLLSSRGCDFIFVPDVDAVNCLYIDSLSSLILRSDFPASSKILELHAKQLGVKKFNQVDMSEFLKADGALTCCSVIFTM